jgi:hypothetical protein
VEVVVVVAEVLDAPGGAAQTDVRPDEGDLRIGLGAVDQPLRTAAGHVGDPEWRQVEPVAAREVDVHVEAVLVRPVAGAAELGSERAAARPREVADH